MKLNAYLKGLIVASFLTAAPSWASFSLEPVIGLNGSSSYLIYGGRIALGSQALSLEGEYTFGSSSSTLAGFSLSNNVHSGKVGLRSEINLGNFFFLTARAGAEGGSNSISGTADLPSVSLLVFSPYVGVGLGINLGSVIRLTGGATVVFPDFSFSTIDLQYLAGIRFSFGGKK